jgi:outer membrane immunogenic protein
MKKVMLGTLALSAAGLVNVAFAADLPVKAPPIVPVVYNWSGCYVGANGGWKYGRFNESVTTVGGSVPGVGLFAPGEVDLDHVTDNSYAVGGQFGCRTETADHWVFGFEGDFDWTNVNGTVVNSSPVMTALYPGDSFYNRERWEASGRIIIGRSYGQWLFYGTGGFAVSRVEMDANFIPVTIGGITYPGAFGSDSRTLPGGTVGLGTAYMISRNWEIGGEYRYTFYGQRAFNLGTPTAGCVNVSTVAVVIACADTPATGHKGLETQEVLLKVNYRFDWGGPIVAKY